MTEHTLGPWQFQSDTGAIVTDEGIPVAFINGALPKRHANGRLIAQAPRLLAALRAVVSAYGDQTWGTLYAMDRALPEARDAIAAAEGEG